jgi:diguanylate cyclase (GGDEF)-like protein
MLKAVGCIAPDHGVGLAVLALFLGVSSVFLLVRYGLGLRSAEARRCRALANAAIEGLLLEQDGAIRFANPALCAMVGLSAAALAGRRLTAVVRGLALTEFDQPGEYDLLLAEGGSRPIEVLWRDGDRPGSHIVAVRDLSVEKATQNQFRRVLQIDPLTGLGTRDLFDHQLQKALALAHRATVGIAVLSIELDRFGSVRDDCGPLAADQIIIEAGRRLRACIRDTDTVVRLGPESFAIIQPLADKPADAAVLADRIVADMALPFDAYGHTVTTSASVGVALYPGDGTTAHDLTRSAGLALGRARQDGGTWRYVESAMDVALRERRSLEQDLRAAVRNGQFSIAYQPYFDTATMETAGFEALLRWHNPARGSIPPAEFIPVAEACGLILPIGRWVLATACEEALSWPQPLTLSVNLSPAQFILPGIVQTVADVLRDTGLPADRLELEITEGTLMDDTQNALRILKELKALGVRIAMDDFGTGYSSLSYLRTFPFDKIKIDRSFISDVEAGDIEAATIVQAILAMGRSLRLAVTAEGVETAQQLSMLKALGCGFVQGYLLGRPGPACFRDVVAEQRQSAAPTQAVLQREDAATSGRLV